MVLIVFVMMMLNIGERAAQMERAWLAPKAWIGPGILAVILLAELVYVLMAPAGPPGFGGEAGPKDVGLVLFGPYLLGVELVSMLLLAGIVGAYHLGWNAPGEVESLYAMESSQQRAVVSGDLVRAGSDRPADTP
jgi:NADH-quinone oxidoreductase subunit J